MKKNIFFLFLFFFICKGYTQNLVVEYQLESKMANLIEREFLLVNQKSAFYFSYVENDNASIEQVLDKYNLKRGLKFYRTLDELETSYFTTILPGNKMTDLYIYKDDLPPIQWKFGKEEKTLLGYPCKKAVTNFRGRNYTVWFTDQIPVSVGPWKFYGLPGLILEIQDEKSEFNYKAIKVLQNTPLEIPNAFNNFMTQYDPLKIQPYKNYVLLNDKNSEEVISRIKASFSKSSIGEFLPARTGMREVVYEWETNKRKQ